jgi:hypothetical protein
MPIATTLRRMLTVGKRAALAAIICGLGTVVSSADVVDLVTSSLNSSGTEPGEIRPVVQIEPVFPNGPVPQSPRPAVPQSPRPPVPQSPQRAAARTTQPRAAPQTTQPRAQDVGPGELNFDPNASIDDLAPPPPPPIMPPPPRSSSQGFVSQSSLGITFGSLSAAPFMMGDFFGGGLANVSGSQTVRYAAHAPGSIISGSPGSASSIIGFEFGFDTTGNDVFTIGLGQDLAGAPDGADTFNIAEPLPPTDAPTSPGPGFVFDGGTAVYTDSNSLTTAQPGVYSDGELWFLDYSYTQTIGINPGNGQSGRPIPSPGVAVRRVKIAENFSPEVRDRAFFNYSFFNDAFGGLGDVSRYILGFEKILVDDLVSFEARLPLAGTYGSGQALDSAASRDFELGNAAFILKGVLLRSDRMIWSGGLGVGVPLASDTVITRGGQNIVVIENEAVHLLPFMGLLLRKNRDTAFQGYAQVDVATNGDPIFADLTGGPLPRIGKFNDSTLLHLDAAVNHVLYRNRRGRMLRELIGNAELHYTGTLQDSDFVSSGGLTYTNLKRNFNIVNATVGMHMAIANHWVVSPGMSVPLRDGLDEQFDYEAILQLNYLH